MYIYEKGPGKLGFALVCDLGFFLALSLRYISSRIFFIPTSWEDCGDAIDLSFYLLFRFLHNN